MEQWKDIPDYIGLYEANIKGVIRNKKTGKNLTGCKDKDGYLITVLSKNGKKKTEKIHRLIAKTFISNINNCYCINHINEIKTDNRVVNLEWCTQSYNNKYSKSIVVKQYTKDMKLLKIWDSAVEAQDKLSIFASNIRDCCRGNVKTAGGFIWKYII